MSHHKRTPEAEKRRADLYEQKQLSCKLIHDNKYKDQINKEEVNLIEKSDIKQKLSETFQGYLLAAVPNVERAEVLDIPNVYHLELFNGCSESE